MKAIFKVVRTGLAMFACGFVIGAAVPAQAWSQKEFVQNAGTPYYKAIIDNTDHAAASIQQASVYFHSPSVPGGDPHRLKECARTSADSSLNTACNAGATNTASGYSSLNTFGSFWSTASASTYKYLRFSSGAAGVQVLATFQVYP